MNISEEHVCALRDFAETIAENESLPEEIERHLSNARLHLDRAVEAIRGEEAG